jgi:hypothetical protein
VENNKEKDKVEEEKDKKNKAKREIGSVKGTRQSLWRGQLSPSRGIGDGHWNGVECGAGTGMYRGGRLEGKNQDKKNGELG